MSNKNVSADAKDTVNPQNQDIRENEVGSPNRANDTRFSPDDKPIKISLEFINEVLLEYLSDVISPTITENDQLVKVPVLYGTPERWASARKDGVLRDEVSSKLLTPLIMLKRTNVSRAAFANPNNKYMYTTLTNKWNPRNAYDKNTARNRVTPSRSLVGVMVPDYVDLTYEVILWTNYQEQMDTLIEQINVEADDYWGEKNNYKFRVKIEEFQNMTDLPASEDRIVRTSFTMKIGAYLIPDRLVSNFKLASTNYKSYTAKKIVVFTENQ